MTPRMLYTERTAYARMGSVRQAIHRVLRRLWWSVPTREPFMFLWRTYRRTWPK